MLTCPDSLSRNSNELIIFIHRQEAHVNVITLIQFVFFLSPEKGYHGVGGLLTVSTPPDVTPISVSFPDAGKFLGYPNVDINGPIQTGFTIPQGTIRRGARCSTSKAFLQSAKDRPNLHVITFAYVTKLLFNEAKRAVAVQFDRFSLTHVVYARREIIVSSGAINSPQLLQLSGIGPKDHLESLGIPVISNLPVGLNLQDHIYPGGIHFKINQRVTLVQRRVVNLPNIIAYFTQGRGMYDAFLLLLLLLLLSTSLLPSAPSASS